MRAAQTGAAQSAVWLDFVLAYVVVFNASEDDKNIAVGALNTENDSDHSVEVVAK